MINTTLIPVTRSILPIQSALRAGLVVVLLSVQEQEGDGSGGRLRHVAALDGLRGLAVAVVLLYHAGIRQFAGGHLGVTMFFTLSGFLITALLLLERERTERISLRSFWARRARRLVPA